MNVFNLLFREKSRPIKRNVDVLLSEGSEEVEFVQGESWNLSDGSIDVVRIQNQRFHSCCGCSAEVPVGGKCSVCSQVACVKHFGNCVECGRAICNLHSKFQDNSAAARVCPSCTDWLAPKFAMQKIFSLLRGE